MRLLIDGWCAVGTAKEWPMPDRRRNGSWQNVASPGADRHVSEGVAGTDSLSVFNVSVRLHCPVSP